ncbi:hypothetical protein [Photobacterium swingsii]|uniref:hypothetical protein n=1 Tax=Photobacterium swingsii TaxID=680026 RepID=UPI004068A59D
MNNNNVTNIKEMLEVIRSVGIKLDDNNVEEALESLEMKSKLKSVLGVAKACELDISTDKVKVAITIVAMNYKKCEGQIESNLHSIIESPCHSLFLTTIKMTPQFQELLNITGDAVCYNKYLW